MKKTLSMILALTLALGVLFGTVVPASADGGEEDDAAVSGVSGDCLWNYDASRGELIISGEGRMDDYAPGGERPWDPCVAALSGYTLRIGDGVSYLGAYAFGDTAVTKIVSEDTAALEIGERAFVNCASLTEFTAPEALRSIGAEAFCGCTALTQVDLNHQIVSFGDRAFYDTGINGIALPPTVTAIGEMALGYLADDRKVDGFTVYCKEGGDAAKEYCDNNGFTCIGWLDTPFFTNVKNSADGVCLDWNDIEDAPIYYIFRRTAKTAWQSVGTSTKSSFVDKASRLTSGTVYYYYVQCRSTDGKIVLSDSDNEISVKYLRTPVLKSLANANGGQVLTWNAVPAAKQYTVCRKAASGNWVKMSTTTKTYYTNTSVKNGVTYSYTVLAQVSGEKSGYDTAGLSLTYCEPPVITSLSNIQNGVRVKWSSVAGAVKYRLYRSFNSSSNWKKVGDIKSCAYNDTALKKKYNGVKVYYTVRPINSSGKFITGYKKTGWKIKYIAAPQITDIAIRANGLKLSWSAVKGASYYKVYRRTADSAKWTAVGKSYSARYLDTKAVGGAAYYYTVQARDKSGNKSGYQTDGFRKKYDTAPAGVKAVSTADGVKLSWKKSAGAEKYSVFRRYSYPASAAKWKAVKVTDDTTFTDTEAKRNVICYYRICCCETTETGGKSKTEYTSVYSLLVSVRYTR